MRLSAGDRSEVIRMEDVVFTLNKIVDDIANMYADSSDHSLLDDSPMEVDATQLGPARNESKEEANLSARPDSPTLSEPPLSARSTGSSDSEDCSSLYSASGGPSPTSSGFTTPSSSPTSLTFINDRDTIDSDRDLSPVPDDVQPGTHFPLERSPGMDTENTSVTETSPSDITPISILEIPSIKLEPSPGLKPFLWTPSLSFDPNLLTSSGSSPSPEQDGIEIIYQTSASPPVFLATPSDHMPGVSPPYLTKVIPSLPPRLRDSPPHLLALRSPILQFTPRLDQNEDWDTGSQTKWNKLGAAHLPKPDSPGSSATSSVSDLPVDGDPSAMRWCVRNGARVSSQVRAPDPNPKSEAGSIVDAPKSTTEGTLVVSGSPQATVPVDQKRPDFERPYAPKKRSPLSRTLLPVSSATMRFQLRTPGDVLSVGKARRKFASMIF
ncbi:hypothetical protein FRC11_005343 [Ceratobasidium sp. 423]|nr:hypothetical protein FRC11_005343 [Ceratobasidium sp. 423]